MLSVLGICLVCFKQVRGKNVVTQWTIKILHKVALDMDLTDAEMEELAALQTVSLLAAGITSLVARKGLF